MTTCTGCMFGDGMWVIGECRIWIRCYRWWLVYSDISSWMKLAWWYGLDAVMARWVVGKEPDEGCEPMWWRSEWHGWMKCRKCQRRESEPRIGGVVSGKWWIHRKDPAFSGVLISFLLNQCSCWSCQTIRLSSSRVWCQRYPAKDPCWVNPCTGWPCCHLQPLSSQSRLLVMVMMLMVRFAVRRWCLPQSAQSGRKLKQSLVLEGSLASLANSRHDLFHVETGYRYR